MNINTIPIVFSNAASGYCSQRTNAGIIIGIRFAADIIIGNFEPYLLSSLQQFRNPGKPFSVAGFGNWFRDRCDEAGLPQCSSHGLRKLAATRLAQVGCSEREIMAVTGHKSVSEVSRYMKA
jgi:integrase